MSRELDPQAEAFLEKARAAGIPPTHALSVDTARKLNADLFVKDEEHLPEIAGTRDLGIEGPDGRIPVRTYLPETGEELPVLVYFHGGGWVLGGLDTHEDVCRELANRVGCVVVSVDYRRAPEHRFPAALDDCYAATEWAAGYAERIGGDPGRIAVAGDSAGGNLAAGVSLMARDRDGPDLANQTLVYPAVNPPMLRHEDAYDENREGYLLEYESMLWFYDRYLRSEADARNEYVFPILADDLSGLPPATVLTCGFDPLRDEGIEYADRLEAAGVPVEHTNYDGMFHGFVSVPGIDRADDALETAAAGLRRAFE